MKAFLRFRSVAFRFLLFPYAVGGAMRTVGKGGRPMGWSLWRDCRRHRVASYFSASWRLDQLHGGACFPEGRKIEFYN